MSAFDLDAPFPVLAVAAWSGTGKTTLLEQLLPLLRGWGLSIGVIKHAHHAFDVDKPGKDSYRLRNAGAAPMLVASRERFALMQETPGQAEPDLASLLQMMTRHAPDLVIVEGFKAWPLPKLVLYRDGVGDPAIFKDPWVRAVALKTEDEHVLDQRRAAPGISRLDLDDNGAIACWIARFAEQWHGADAGRPLNA
ncbi:MAG: molybdopterin-guanine dinucleotide biosynthesis protein B [Halomonas subglaciescola]|nr:molybdopterin-guanine dinucleotide biosynthesis protein B [Halomonas subglaciescola]